MGWSARLLASKAVKQANRKPKADYTAAELQAIVDRWYQKQGQTPPDQQAKGGS